MQPASGAYPRRALPETEMNGDLIQGKPLELLAQEINDEHGAMIVSANDVADRWIRIGTLLAEARERVPRGWKRWCQENLSFSSRQADKYIRLAKYGLAALKNENSSSHFLENTSLHAALKLIAEPKPKKPATPQKPKPPPDALAIINDALGTSYESLDAARVAHTETDTESLPEPKPINGALGSYAIEDLCEYADHTIDEMRQLYIAYCEQEKKKVDISKPVNAIRFAVFARSKT